MPWVPLSEPSQAAAGQRLKGHSPDEPQPSCSGVEGRGHRDCLRLAGVGRGCEHPWRLGGWVLEKCTGHVGEGGVSL